MNEVLTLEPDDASDRFARFHLISWWDQQRLARARVVLIGVGALGNEAVRVPARSQKVRRTE